METTRILPSTRYIGSKRRLIRWIWDHIGRLRFNSFLDAFGGTGIVGYYAKLHGKQVFYNEILKSFYQVGLAIIENESVRLIYKDVEFLLQKHEEIGYPDFIEKTFNGMYYTGEENRWLDMIATNITMLRNKYKRAIAFSALIQSCLVKRPFNLFHRANLQMRLRDVKRGFRNHHIWNKPFGQLFKRFVEEYNRLVFSNGRVNKAFNLDVFELDVKADLVYLDPPYVPREGSVIDYRLYYHFLEGLVDYERWPKRLNPKSSIKAMKLNPSPWVQRENIKNAFEMLIRKFKDAKYIVVSYRAEGVPSPREISQILKVYKCNLQVYSTNIKYVLSKKMSRELLFVAF